MAASTVINPNNGPTSACDYLGAGSSGRRPICEAVSLCRGGWPEVIPCCLSVAPGCVERGADVAQTQDHYEYPEAVCGAIAHVTLPLDSLTVEPRNCTAEMHLHLASAPPLTPSSRRGGGIIYGNMNLLLDGILGEV